MRVFIDFEASSLADDGYPIEVGWVFEDGRSSSHLIRPAAGWIDWSAVSQGIHGIDRLTLEREGEPVGLVAQRMIDVLTGHDLLATAPSWDGKWLSRLLRAADLPRHALRVRDTELAWRETAHEILFSAAAPDALDREIDDVIAAVLAVKRHPMPAHRALVDAEDELDRWMRICSTARMRAVELTRE